MVGGSTFRCGACSAVNFVTELRLFRANDEPLACWECAAFVDHTALKLEPVRENRHQDLIGRPVEVRAAGILYRGTFVEMSDEDVKLRGPTGWIILPLTNVTRVSPADVPVPSLPQPAKSVPPGFYEDPDEEH